MADAREHVGGEFTDVVDVLRHDRLQGGEQRVVGAALHVELVHAGELGWRHALPEQLEQTVRGWCGSDRPTANSAAYSSTEPGEHVLDGGADEVEAGREVAEEGTVAEPRRCLRQPRW